MVRDGQQQQLGTNVVDVSDQWEEEEEVESTELVRLDASGHWLRSVGAELVNTEQTDESAVVELEEGKAKETAEGVLGFVE